MEIIPTILPKDYEELKTKISKVKDYIDVIQIDFCDGLFVKSKTWPFAQGGINEVNFKSILNEETGLPYWEDVDFEFDLMVASPVDDFDLYLKLGAKRIIFHLESITSEKLRDFLEGIDPYLKDNVEIGLAIGVETEIEELDSFVNLIDFVQFMGILHEGFQGEKFDERVYNRIKDFKIKYPEVIVSVDGGVNLENGRKLKEAGADVLVSGSTVFDSPDIIETIEDFKNL
jgi:ribulose-phosphate 3-epimerase